MRPSRDRASKLPSQLIRFPFSHYYLSLVSSIGILCSAAICCYFCAVSNSVFNWRVGSDSSTALNCWKLLSSFKTTRTVSLRQPNLPPRHASLTRNWISTGCICLSCEASDSVATRSRITGGLETTSLPVRHFVLL